MTFYVRCSKCGRYGECQNDHGNLVPEYPKDWICIHAINPEVRSVYSLLGILCISCQGPAIDRIKLVLLPGEE